MRSVVAIIVGFITFSVALYAMQSASTLVLRQLHPDLGATTTIVNYSTNTRVFWLIWEAVGLSAAGYVTARLAASSHVAHATVMGAIQAVVTLWAMLTVPSGDPMWFWIIGVALMIPAAWFGGRMARGGV